MVFLDCLPVEALGSDGSYAEFLSGKLVQSPGEPPAFVDGSLVRVPDVIWRAVDSTRPSAPRKRVYRFVEPQTIAPVVPAAWLGAQRAVKMHPRRREVCRALATFADHETGRNVRPAAGTIATLVGLSRPRVAGHLRALVADGWLAPTGKAPSRGVIVYALTHPA